MVTIPNTLLNEQAVIAACLDDEGSFAEVSLAVTAADFTFKPLAKAFAWMKQLFMTKRPVDLWTLQNAYGAEEGFPEALDSIRSAPQVLKGSAAHYAAILADRASLRRLILSLDKALDAAAAAESYQDARMAAESILMECVGEAPGKEIKSTAEAVAEIRREMAKGPQVEFRHPTGFKTVDDMLKGGPGEGHLMILCGPTGGGKTTLAANMITNFAEKGLPCGIFSLEMSTRELVLRCGLSMIDNVNGADPLDKVAGLPIWISDRPDRTAESVRAAIRLMVIRYGVKAVMVDYLQLLQTMDPKQQRERQVAEFSRQLKIAAKESGVLVLALSQVNEEGRLRESKAIEQDADGILHIVLVEGRHYLWLSKNRHGPKHGMISDIVDKVEKEGIKLDFHDRNFRFTQY